MGANPNAKGGAKVVPHVKPVGKSNYSLTEEGDKKRQEQYWEAVERQHDGIIHDVVCAVTRAGDAIQFSRSRDGGAYGVTVYSNGVRHVEWRNTPNDAVELLLRIISDARRASGDL